MELPRPAPRPARYAALGASTLVWSSTFLAISIGNDTVSPVWAATLRLALAAAVLVGITLVRRQRLPSGRGLRSAALYGFFQFGLNLPLLYWAETRVPSGLSAIIFATLPLNNALLARAFGLERLTAAKIAGALVAFAGVAVIFSGQLTVSVDPLHLAAAVAATWAASLGAVFLKRGPRASPIGANAVGAAIGCATCAVASALAGERQALPTTLASVLPIVYLALAASVGAFVLWVWLLNHSPLTRISYISVVTPVVALALGVVLRHERVAPASLAGSLVVLAGVWLGVRAPRAERGESDREQAAAADGAAADELAPPLAGE